MHSRFWYSIHLLDVLLMSPTLQNVVRAVTGSIKHLGVTAVFGFFCIYIFAAVGLFWLEDESICCNNSCNSSGGGWRGNSCDGSCNTAAGTTATATVMAAMSQAASSLCLNLTHHPSSLWFLVLLISREGWTGPWTKEVNILRGNTGRIYHTNRCEDPYLHINRRGEFHVHTRSLLHLHVLLPRRLQRHTSALCARLLSGRQYVGVGRRSSRGRTLRLHNPCCNPCHWPCCKRGCH
jgi:hypothetical protein